MIPMSERSQIRKKNRVEIEVYQLMLVLSTEFYIQILAQISSGCSSLKLKIHQKQF